MTNPVERHYTQGELVSTIEAGLRAAGKTPETVSVDDLGAVDEFHIGGRPATRDLLSQLELGPGVHALDVGAGLGGTARFARDRFDCRVTGVDLTAEFVEAAKTLSRWVGLEGVLCFRCASALAMPFPDASFDRAFQLHVGMNIADKAALFAEIHRVLRPGALFGIYDVMKTADGALTFPVPWATAAQESHLAAPEVYTEALRAGGFEILAQRDRRAMAREFFQKLRARASEGAPPVGLHLVMGEEAPRKVSNMIANLESGLVSPVEVIARRLGPREFP